MDEKRYLTFALGKGRLARQTLALFEQIGITCEEINDPDTRKLIFVNEDLKLRLFLLHSCFYILNLLFNKYFFRDRILLCCPGWP